MGQEPLVIDELIYCVSKIFMMSNGQARFPCVVGSATGFFYEYDDEDYLITNRHVVINEQERFFPDSINFMVHTSRTSNIPNRPVSIPLYDENGESVWLEHPDQPQFNVLEEPNIIDVAAIPISSYINSETDVYTPLSIQSAFPREYAPHLGQSVIILCYPLGFYDRMHNLPIVKNGTIASVYGSRFDGNRFFIIDTNLQSGTSGGPVLLNPDTTLTDREGNIIMGIFPSYLLGVHSAEYSRNGVNLGLNIVWYRDIIDEIISQ